MKWATVGVLLMLLSALVIPVVAAESEEKFSYITVEEVTVHLVEEQAVITMNYQIDDGIGFLVLLLGKSDLKRKVGEVLKRNGDGAAQLAVDLHGHGLAATRRKDLRLFRGEKSGGPGG